MPVQMMTLAIEARTDEGFTEPMEPHDDEAMLVREALNGGAHAFEQIVRTYDRRVFHFLHQMTRQRQDAEDLAQQTFIKAFQHLDRFDTGRPLINWLLTIARRTALNHFRSSRKWESVPDETAAVGLSPAGQAEERDQSDHLWERARATLSRREFEILWLRFAEELSIQETAQVVGLTQTHVKVLVHRARKALLKERKCS